MAKKDPKFTANQFDESSSSSTSQTTQSTHSQNVLDNDLLNLILSGLTPNMTDEEITAYAEALLKPQLNAGIEASQQQYESTKLAKEQEIEDIAAALARNIAEQEGAYAKSMANVETAALNRGMGRSSYTLQTLANQGSALAKAVQQLTEESTRQQGQIQQQITQAAQQNAQTQGRLNTDYASNLAAKIQELKQGQRTSFDQNYMTAVSAAMGSRSDTSSSTQGTSGSLNISGRITNGQGNTYAQGSSSSGVSKPPSTTVTVNQK
jgi:hypothetical protein